MKCVDWRPAYIKGLSETGKHTTAAEFAGIDRLAAFHQRRSDPEFAAACEQAIQAASESLEAEAIRRAKEGVQRLKFNSKTGEAYRDPRTGEYYVEHEYSDTLMTLLLRGLRPDRYRDRSSVEMEHSGGVQVEEAIYVNLPPIIMAPPALLA